ncbi:MAG: hypothetical protein KDB27_33240, partial [Planctomycetales bacterium]|nr:hypothetical protein [Planctomycetales bacterium]
MSNRPNKQRKKKVSENRNRDAESASAQRVNASRSYVLIGCAMLVGLAIYVALERNDSAGSLSNSNDPDSKLHNTASGVSSLDKIPNVHSERRPTTEYALFRAPEYARQHSFNNETVLVWGGDHKITNGLHRNANLSNITRADYAGTESCRGCHAENYSKWENHAHRWMNVQADEESVKGDFSGTESATIKYRSGL